MTASALGACPMVHLAENVFEAPRLKPNSISPLFRDAGLHLALFGGGLAGSLLIAISAAVLSWRGTIIAALCYGVVVLLIIRGLSRHDHAQRFGLANAITLARASMTALLFGLASDHAAGGGLPLTDTMRWLAIGLAGLVLLLDGLDGYAARRSGMASRFGAYFDMEADALFILVLSLLVTATGAIGPWIAVYGCPRYAFVVLGGVSPRFRAPLKPLIRRKVIFVLQASAPLLALMPFCPARVGTALCAIAFSLVLYSFAADCRWLWSSRQSGRHASSSQRCASPSSLGVSSLSTVQ